MGPGAKRCRKSCPTMVRSPDRPACSQSLYRLSYPAHDGCLVVAEFVADLSGRPSSSVKYGPRSVPHCRELAMLCHCVLE